MVGPPPEIHIFACCRVLVLRVRARVCARACVCACVCARACVPACVRARPRRGQSPRACDDSANLCALLVRPRAAAKKSQEPKKKNNVIFKKTRKA